jgi:hypothetical protein
MAARLSRATLCPLLELTARACRQLVCLQGMGNWRPTCRSEEVRVSRLRHVVWVASWSEAETACANKHVVGGEDFSCEAESCQ